MGLLEEVGRGELWLDSDGQGLSTLEKDPLAKAAGKQVRGMDACHLTRYAGTDLIQWCGRRSDGRYYPFGPIFRLTKAGKLALNSGSRP